MKTVLNTTSYQVDPKFVEGIAQRLTQRLLRLRTDRVCTDWIAVTTELQRLYGPAIKQKDWYKDFVMQFCIDRKISCRMVDL